MPDQNYGNIKYAVIPVAGLGTRLLPATKAIQLQISKQNTKRKP